MPSCWKLKKSVKCCGTDFKKYKEIRDYEESKLVKQGLKISIDENIITNVFGRNYYLCTINGWEVIK